MIAEGFEGFYGEIQRILPASFLPRRCDRWSIRMYSPKNLQQHSVQLFVERWAKRKYPTNHRRCELGKQRTRFEGLSNFAISTVLPAAVSTGSSTWSLISNLLHTRKLKAAIAPMITADHGLYATAPAATATIPARIELTVDRKTRRLRWRAGFLTATHVMMDDDDAICPSHGEYLTFNETLQDIVSGSWCCTW